MTRRRWFTLGISAPLSFSLSACGQDKPTSSKARDQLTLIDLPKVLGVDSGTSLSERLNAGLLALAPKEPQEQDKALFRDYQSAQAQWSTRWTRQFNFTGVAWNSPQAGTLITDRHVIMAKHYQHAIGAPLLFHDAKGKPVQRTIVARLSDPSTDMAVGLLNAPVPESIAVYPLLRPNVKWHDMLTNAWLILTDNERKFLVYPIRAVPYASDPAKPELLMAALDPARRLHKMFEETLVSGDSGHPSFLWAQGHLILMSVHTQGGNGSTGPFLGGGVNQDWLKTAVRTLKS